MHLMDNFTKTRNWRNFVSKVIKSKKDMPLEVLDYISIMEDQIQSINERLKEVEDGWKQQEEKEG